MAGPAPIVINFLVRGVANVQKAMKSITDTITQQERQSTAAVSGGVTARSKERDREIKASAKAYSETARLLTAAERSGSKSVEKELRVRLANQLRHAQALHKVEQDKYDAINKSAKKHSADVAHSKEAEFAKLVKLSEKWQKESAKGAESLEQHKKSLRDRAARDHASVVKDMALEEKKLQLEVLRGNGGVKPALSAQARLRVLEAAKNKSPEEQRAALEKVRDMGEEARVRRKLAKDEHADRKRAEDQATQVLERAEKNRLAIRERSAAMAGRLAAKQAREEAAARRQADAEAQSKRDRFARTVVGVGGRAIQSATTIGGAVARGVLNVGGGFSIEDSVQREIAFRGRAATIAATTQSGISQSQLMTQARSLGIAQGIDPEDVLRGYEQVKKLNDDALPQALRVMPDIAKIAKVTGTDMGDMGELAANITAANPKITDAQLKSQLRIFARQGIEGGVEIADFAKYGARITAGATLFTGDREANEATLGMAAQVARQKGGAASAAEATLAAQRFGTDLQKKAGHLKELGIDVEAGDGKIRNVEDVIVDMLKKQSSVTGISEFKIGERGNRVLTGFADIYREAGGGEAGERAVRARFAAGRKDISEADVESRFQKRQSEVDIQLNTAMIKLRTEVGQKLVPVLANRLIPALIKAMPLFEKLLTGFAKLADWAVQNPLAGMGALLGAAVGKEVAAAGLKAVLERSLASSLGAAGGLSIASAAIAITAATLAVQKMAEDESKRQTEGAEATLRAANAMPLLRPGGIKNKEDLDEAKGAAAGLKKSIGEAQNEKGGSKLWFGTALAGAAIADAATFGFAGATKNVVQARKETTAIDEQRIKEQTALLERYNKAIEAGEKAMQSFSKTAGNATPAIANPGAPQRNVPIARRQGG